jgi:hypothetical protein
MLPLVPALHWGFADRGLVREGSRPIAARSPILPRGISYRGIPCARARIAKSMEESER